MWQRFTPRARRVVLLAQEEADRMKSKCVGTEHLLLGLLRETKGGAFCILYECGVTLAGVRSFVPDPKHQECEGEPQLTPKAKRALEMSAEASCAMGLESIGTEHLLLALMCDEDCSAAQILKRFRLDAEAVHIHVLNSFDALNRSSHPKMLSIPTNSPILPTYGEPEPLPITQRLLDVLQTAVESAQNMEQMVETHHFLLGLTLENQGMSALLLRSNGVTPDAVHAACESLQGPELFPEQRRFEDDEVRLSHRAERVLELAADKARRERCRSIEPEHLLFVLCKYQNAAAHEILRYLSLDPQALSEEIVFDSGS